jgi:hypothetical protein
MAVTAAEAMAAAFITADRFISTSQYEQPAPAGCFFVCSRPNRPGGLG